MAYGKTKITLSAKELELVCDTSWILTKHTILNKVIELFAMLLSSVQEVTVEQQSSLPVEVFVKDPKISRGENYKGLPYVMLDYPRYFGKENTLAVRNFFWWGNFFSINLHLAGKTKKMAAPALIAGFLELQQNDFWLCVNDNPWQHTFEEDNYIPFQNITITVFRRMLDERPFIKIGKKISLQRWDEVAGFAEKTFMEMILFLKISYPNDEKDPSPGTPIIGSGL